MRSHPLVEDLMRFNPFARLFMNFLVVAGILLTASSPAPNLSTQQASDFRQAALTQISFVPNIETAGVVVGGVNLPRTTQMFYRRSGEQGWRAGHQLMRIDDGRLIGSLFGLAPASIYEVRVSDGASEISGVFTTQPEELTFAPATILHVNDDAPAGGDGSAVSPFKTIGEAVSRATPGTQVLVADGVYNEAVTFPGSGTAGNWIQVKAEGGGAVLDGSIPIAADAWIPHETKSHVWFTKIGPGIKYLARNQQRFYLYDDLNGLLTGMGHKDVAMDEGWFYDPANTRLYVRTQKDPSTYTWQLPRLNQAFYVEGRDWIWVEGFEVRFYGTEYGCGICTKNASHIVIRKNRIHNIQNGVFVDWAGGEDRGNDTRIEFNDISDPPLNEWPWNAVKATSMEATAIVLRGHIGAIVRGNQIHHYFNGIYTSSSAAMDNPGVAFDADIYNNNLHHISDDALEPEGTCVNHRFRNNTINTVLVGVSLAPVTMGPVWLLRSTIANFTGRSIKWDRNSDGWVMIYHNTSWTSLPSPNTIEMISTVHNSIMRNNIFQGTGYSIEEHRTGSTGHDWNYDNWYTTFSGPHFKWENLDIYNTAQLCSGFGFECNGYEDLPGLVNPVGGDFSLTSSSSNIDRGVLILGINDIYYGSAPDIGALESTFGDPPPATGTPLPTNTPMIDTTPLPTATVAAVVPPLTASIFRTDPTPGGADRIHFSVNFSKDVSGVDVNDFTITSSGAIVNYAIEEVAGSGAAYAVTVYTGVGDGTLRLDLLDNDSIVDSSMVPLGGVGAGNGNFTSGEVYTINKSAPIVTSILRADPSPTAAGTVRFAVTFSEPVSGVDTADFWLSVTDGVTDAAVTSIVGTDSYYIATVNTGNGDGSLRLDVLDNDSIVDLAGLPLGNPGVGNGNYSMGESYTVNRSTPVIQTATFTSDGGNDGWILESKETSNKGGTTNAKAVSLRVGDNAQNNQYRVILHFPTGTLPDNAVVTQAILTLQLESVVGGNPFTTHGNMWVDLRNGAFGSFGPFQIGALQTSDFQAPATVYTAGIISNNPVGGWYWTTLNNSSLPSINLLGTTQIRLGFQLDDDNDKKDDYMTFFSGNYSVASARPQLAVKYYIPK